MPPEVLAAMQDAARYHIELDEMQKRVGAKIAELTHNEACYVSTGAAAGITLAAAACMTGKNPAYMQQLPDTTGLPKYEFIVHKSHRNGYDHAIRASGGKVVEIGSAVTTHRWELEHAINTHTAAIFWFQGAMTGHGDLSIETVIEVANARGVPVIVDAAAQLPPVENLWKFTKIGAAMAIFSGGKDLRGPQATGLCLGRRELVEAMAMNGSPNHSVGRAMKVGKEEMGGALAAVERYLKLDHAGRRMRDERVVAQWNSVLCAIPGVCAERSFPNEAGQPLPRTRVIFEAPFNRDDIVRQLMTGEPAIAVANGKENDIFLNPMSLEDDEVEIVLNRLLEVLS
jgi:L-seryl-tRNA(Ser) seleniumtransferase